MLNNEYYRRGIIQSNGYSSMLSFTQSCSIKIVKKVNDGRRNPLAIDSRNGGCNEIAIISDNIACGDQILETHANRVLKEQRHASSEENVNSFIRRSLMHRTVHIAYLATLGCIDFKILCPLQDIMSFERHTKIYAGLILRPFYAITQNKVP